MIVPNKRKHKIKLLTTEQMFGPWASLYSFCLLGHILSTVTVKITQWTQKKDLSSRLCKESFIFHCSIQVFLYHVVQVREVGGGDAPGDEPRAAKGTRAGAARGWKCRWDRHPFERHPNRGPRRDARGHPRATEGDGGSAGQNDGIVRGAQAGASGRDDRAPVQRVGAQSVGRRAASTGKRAE